MINKTIRFRASLLSFTILLLLGCYLAPASIYAQDPAPPPPPARDYFPDKWDEYHSQTGKFRIRFPGEPQERVKTQDGIDEHYMEYKGLLLYRLSYVDYETRIDDPQKRRDILKGMKATALRFIKVNNHRLVSERDVTVDGYQGLFVQFEVQGKEVIRLQWLVVGSRVFTISTLGRKGSPLDLEGNDDYEKVALGFINSFHLVP